MTEDTIHVEEELNDAAAKAEETGRRWSEEINVRGSELMDTVNRLLREATVRKITVKGPSGKTLVEIPLVLGAAGMLIIGPWTAFLLVAAWLTRVSILIEYEEAPSKVEETVEGVVEEVKAAVA